MRQTDTLPVGRWSDRERESHAVRDLRLDEVDDSDKSCQFRLTGSEDSLVPSLARDGQLAPIKVVAGGMRFRVIDGFRRTVAARELGWQTIRARIYPPMSASEARKISFVENIARQRGLTVLEKSSAIQQARSEGYPKSELAAMFEISERQIERYIALPDSLLEFIDGRQITMAHARILARYEQELTGEDVRKLIEEVRAKGMTAAELSTVLGLRGLGGSVASHSRSLGQISPERVRVFNLNLSRSAPAESREQTLSFLRRAVAQIEGFRVGETGAGAESS